MLEAYRYDAGKFPVQFFVFLLTGTDVSFFLQNQSTYNFESLQDNEFHVMSFLDPQGRAEFYCWAVRMDSKVLLLTPPLLKEVAQARLEKFLISEDVSIEEQGLQDWCFILGPKSFSHSTNSSFKGLLFEEKAILGQIFKKEVSNVSFEERELWRSLNGWPDFSGKDFEPEIINNLRLFDLSVSQNKGCYPGQETVSKIATRRGAAYSPVLLETLKPQTSGPIYIFDKKIGEIESCHEWQGVFYSSAKLLRDFRVSGMKINFVKDENEIESVVRYYPLLPGDDLEKAQELYYIALEAFKMDDFVTAEKFLKHAIDLDPKFADAYESLGVILGRLNRFPEAIELMDHLTNIDPTSVLAHTNKSLFLMKMGKIDEAEEQKSLATVKSFQKFGDEAKLKELVLKEKKAQEAEWIKRESMFKQVLEIDDEDTLANYGLGSIAVERQDWLPAINHLEKVIKADANYSVAYLSLGKAYKGAGLNDKAMTIWKEGINIAAKKGDLMPANQMQFELQQL
jgi:tetratricopeptide (TPR) repeat protein